MLNKKLKNKDLTEIGIDINNEKVVVNDNEKVKVDELLIKVVMNIYVQKTHVDVVHYKNKD